ncbi:hypothetical protein SAMIE_1031750 [Sphingobium amiense]|uniref:Uncharacterized protein n=1 Tax=Sphingobium amiense TaxID=135719 RepID=A0A494W534_9SPHN|nr:hypothetical protein [Sphingobium amiense]BBD99674.1 hypothetical protein SAMIE_1031750 [Sphingobium amiense]
MPDVHVECVIDGQSFSYAQIRDVQYHRNLHWLHEMKRLGADIVSDGVALSHEGIDLLGRQAAHRVSVDIRKALGAAGLKALFKEQLRASDLMWKELSASPNDASPKFCFADMKVTGLSFEQFQEAIALENFQRRYAEINPDHCFLNLRDNGIHSMEIFGMYGGPSEVHLTIDPNIDLPFEPDPEFPMLVKGFTTLASDETPINIFVAHQYKPLENGVAMRLGCIFPAAAPQELVDGHKWHSAIEFWELVQPGGPR